MAGGDLPEAVEAAGFRGGQEARTLDADLGVTDEFLGGRIVNATGDRAGADALGGDGKAGEEADEGGKYEAQQRAGGREEWTVHWGRKFEVAVRRLGRALRNKERVGPS